MRGGHKIFLKVREDLRIGGAACLEPARNRGGSKVILNGLMVDATEGRDRRLLNGVTLSLIVRKPPGGNAAGCGIGEGDLELGRAARLP